MSVPRKVKAVVAQFKKYQDDITFFRVKPEFPCKFKPGQFLHLALDKYDPSFNWPESRVFSIASAPGKDYIDILVSPKGRFTKRMVNELSVGSEIWIKIPYGIFNFKASVDKPVGMIAGGTGISPFISYLEYLLEGEAVSPSVKLYYGVRSSDLIIFGHILKECRQKIKNFDYTIYCEQAINKKGIELQYGILPVVEIVKETSAILETVFYLSGPSGMIKAFERELLNCNISSDRILFDKWE